MKMTISSLILSNHRNLVIQGKDVLSKDQTNLTENSEVRNFTPKQSYNIHL